MVLKIIGHIHNLSGQVLPLIGNAWGKLHKAKTVNV